MDAFDELLALGLVRATDVPRRFRFRHPARAPRGLRERARRLAAAAPTSACAAGARRPRRAGAGAGAPRRALRAPRRPRRGRGARARPASAALSAPGERRALVQRRAAPAVRRRAPAEQRVELLLARARALAAEGRLAESHADLLEPASRSCRRTRRPACQLTTTCAGVERLLGRHDEAHARLLARLDHLPDASAPDAIAL